MCGRYSLTSPVEAMAQLFGFPDRPNLAPRYNIAPTQQAPVVRLHGTGRELALLRWGLVPHWAKDPSIAARLINARAETVAEKPSFRDAFRRRRCLVPADGYYEWQKLAGARQPWRMVLAGGETQSRPFAFAGLWERWAGPDGAALETFTILTTEANTATRDIHPRMPVVLEPDAHALWLEPTADRRALEAVLKPYPSAAMTAYKVGRRVGNVRHDDAGLIAPLPETGPLI